MSMNPYLQDRIRGSLIGGALGDALGYPVEFIDSYEKIQTRYGEHGITQLDTNQNWLPEEEQTGKAVVSDDTQMTLYTANGLLNAKKQNIAPKYGICSAYIQWYLTQVGKNPGRYNSCWIGSIPELCKRRAPGNTCITALSDIYRGREPYNNSKGCGGVMRIAPIPLYAAVNNRMSITEADMLAADAAEITHQHPLGYISAALMAHVIYSVIVTKTPTKGTLIQSIINGLVEMNRLFPHHRIYVDEMEDLALMAIDLAANDKPDLHNIRTLGGGWVGEQTLAIALYCAIRHFGNLQQALVAAVNHEGDSDSTGAVTGNILGAAIGYHAISASFMRDLELKEVILHMADDLYLGEVTKYEL